MLRSLYAGVSGLRAHQTMMDVVGNDIANVNTTGYKSSETIFEDTLSQMIKAAGSPQGAQGGTNPAQVGLGVSVAGIETNFAQGATQLTGRATDLAVQGDGFFAVREGGENVFTRAGSFSFDSNGTLVTPTGAVAQGWIATNGVINTNASTTDLRLPLGSELPPVQSSASTLAGNVPADATPYVAGPPATGTRITTSITLYDGQGTAFPVTYQIDNTAPNAWSLQVLDSAGTAIGAPTAVAFNPATGALTSPATITFSPAGASWGGKSVTLDLSGLTQYGGTNTYTAQNQNGSATGVLQSFTISPDGTLVGVFSNGLKQPLGQVALATFNNPPGLEKVGNSEYRATVNSGVPQLGTAGSGGRGQLASGVLEMSNVDLSRAFSDLIVAERGFQANSKVITTSDQILQDLVNLKQ